MFIHNAYRGWRRCGGWWLLRQRMFSGSRQSSRLPAYTAGLNTVYAALAPHLYALIRTQRLFAIPRILKQPVFLILSNVGPTTPLATKPRPHSLHFPHRSFSPTISLHTAHAIAAVPQIALLRCSASARCLWASGNPNPTTRPPTTIVMLMAAI